MAAIPSYPQVFDYGVVASSSGYFYSNKLPVATSGYTNPLRGETVEMADAFIRAWIRSFNDTPGNVYEHIAFLERNILQFVSEDE